MPGRLEMRTTREQHQEGSRGCLVEYQVQQLKGRWVCPVQVFQDKEYRLTFSKFQEDGDDGFERFLSLTLWGQQIEPRIAVFRDGKRKERCEQRNRFL